MLEKLKIYLFVGAFFCAGAGAVACDDDAMPADEWSSTYVYLKRPNLANEVPTFLVEHSSKGIRVQEVTVPVVVRLSKARGHDLTIELSASSEGIPAEVIAFKNGGTLVIPAGELEARDTLLVTDWAFAGQSKEAAEWQIEVAIARMAPVAGDLRLSTREAIRSVKVIKYQYSNVLNGQKPEGARIADRSGWTVRWTTDKTETEWTTDRKVVDDNNWSYLYVNNYLSIELDLGSAQTLTGLETVSGYGASYAHTACAILTSDDGVTWTEQSGRSAIKAAGTQYVSFDVPVTARYFRWRMYGGNCLSSEIYAWQAAE